MTEQPPGPSHDGAVERDLAASTGEQPNEWVLVPRSPTTEMLKAAYDDARADDNPLNALDCWDSMIETAPAPPSPAAVVDHIEQAQEIIGRSCGEVVDYIHGSEPLVNWRVNERLIVNIAAALSERDTAAIRAFAKRIWSDGEEVAYQAGVRDTLERLK
jgi:hypothetical protein